MKYSVRYYENQMRISKICGSKEETVAFVQTLRLTKKIPVSLIKITPHIEPNTVVFNKMTLETRLVESVDEKMGAITVYDTDNLEALKDSRTKHTLKIREKWKKDDCIPVDIEKLKKCGFKFGSSMGRLSEDLSIYHEWGIFE